MNNPASPLNCDATKSNICFLSQDRFCCCCLDFWRGKCSCRAPDQWPVLGFHRVMMISRTQVSIWPPQIKEHLLQDLASASSFELIVKKEGEKEKPHKEKKSPFMWVDLSAPVLFSVSGAPDVFPCEKTQTLSQIPRLLFYKSMWSLTAAFH